MTPAEPVVVALDIGGTKTTAALVANDLVLARAHAPTPAREGASAVLECAAGLIAQVRAEHTEGESEPIGLGVATAGVVDPRTGAVISSTDAISGWTGTPVRTALAGLTGLDTVVLNDVQAHALGEALHGAGTTADSLLFVAVGTGIGAALVIDSRVRPGAHGAAGHAGHLPSPHAGDRPCPCGRTGHLEAIASGPAIASEHARLGGRGDGTLQTVLSSARAGDSVAQQALSLGAGALGAAVAGLVNTLDPDVVVVAGGVTGAGDAWWDGVTRSYADQALPLLADTPLIRSTLGQDAALLGAAAASRTRAT